MSACRLGIRNWLCSNKVYGIRIQKDVLRGRANRRERRLQTLVEVADTREEQVTAHAPNQQAGKGDRLGMAPDVAIGLLARQLAEHRTLRVAGPVDQHQQ